MDPGAGGGSGGKADFLRVLLCSKSRRSSLASASIAADSDMMAFDRGPLLMGRYPGSLSLSRTLQMWVSGVFGPIDVRLVVCVSSRRWQKDRNTVLVSGQRWMLLDTATAS